MQSRLVSMAKQKFTFKIIIIENGKTTTYECESKKEKNQWFYNLLTQEERMWAWEQWKNSKYKTYNKWFKKFIQSEWEESHLQSFQIRNKVILIKKQEKLKKDSK